MYMCDCHDIQAIHDISNYLNTNSKQNDSTYMYVKVIEAVT